MIQQKKTTATSALHYIKVSTKNVSPELPHLLLRRQWSHRNLLFFNSLIVIHLFPLRIEEVHLAELDKLMGGDVSDPLLWRNEIREERTLVRLITFQTTNKTGRNRMIA